MKLFLSVRGKGALPNKRIQYYTPEFPCKMLVKMWGKITIIGKREIEVDCESPLTLAEFSQELEIISEDFYNEFNNIIERKTLELELSGKHSDVYKLKNTVPSYGYDVYEIK